MKNQPIKGLIKRRAKYPLTTMIPRLEQWLETDLYQLVKQMLLPSLSGQEDLKQLQALRDYGK